MAISRPFLIGNVRTGLERDLEPWLLPNDAYPDLEDCYMFRGRIPRRLGFTQLGRIVTEIVTENMGNANGASFSGTLVHADISPGSVTITVGALVFTDSGVFGDQTGVLNTSPVSGNVGTINYITGAITLTFSPALGGATAVIANYEFYDRLPVMGLRTREINIINEEQLIGFDTIKANAFSNINSRFQDITFHKTTLASFSWTGANSDFFWTVNYLNAFWATNNVKGFQANPTATNPAFGDGIRWYDGTGWVNFLPQVDGTNFLMGSLMMVTYRNRLVMLNTTEGSAFGTFTNYPQRARWSQNGTPYYVAPVPAGFTGGTNVDSWRSDIVGRGGFIDAPTQEQIISAEFYKDTLVVFFERSTWQLRYTGNETLPFVWERINVDFGAESTFSIVPFDAGVIAVGNYGIVSCDATGVKRIDEKIPDEVFEFHNGNSGPKRVYGIRDYSQQLVYWTFPADTENPIFPTRVLVYNYLDGSYSFFTDSFTCFGTYQPFNDTTWADLNTVSWAGFPFQWNKGDLQSDFPEICAGNQQGFVFKEINDGTVNNATASLFITAATQAQPTIITSPNHNLEEGQIITIASVLGMTQLNGGFYRVSTPITANTFAIQTYNSTTGVWQNVDSTAFGAYTAGGLITVRNNISIVTKRFNPFLESGSAVRLTALDLFVEATTAGEFTVNIYANENSNTPMQTLIISSSTVTGQEKVWFRANPSVIGQFVQIEITFSDAQMIDVVKSNANVVIHAMIPWMAPAGRLISGMPS